VSARLTLAAGIVSGMAALALCFGALYWVLLPQHFPLTRVDLKGNFEKTSKAELAARTMTATIDPRSAGRGCLPR